VGAPDLVGEVGGEDDFLLVLVATGEEQRGLVLLALALEDQDRVEGAVEAEGGGPRCHDRC
jgi:hypothetical protein